MFHWKSRLSFIWSLLKGSLGEFSKHNALRLSAALSYYAVFSIAPLLLLAIGTGSLVFGEDAVRGELSRQLRGVMGPTAATGVEKLLSNATLEQHGALATILGVLTMVVGATGVFNELKDALNTIWEVQIRPGRSIAAFFRSRLLSFGLVLVVGFLLLVSLVATTVLAALTSHLRSWLPVPDVAWSLVNLGTSFVLSLLLFAAIFKILPDVHLAWRTVLVGSATTALLFEIGKFGLAFYLGREGAASSFGAAGSIVLVLLWVYYAAAILLLGAGVTRTYARLKGFPVRPLSFAERVPTAPPGAVPAPNA